MSTDTPPASRGYGWPAALITLGVIWLIYLTAANSSTLWDRDEPRYATATLEMLESGNYLYPTFNGELRPHQPAMVYWLMSTSVRVLGPTELAVRLPSTIGVLLAGLMTYALGRQLFNARAAWWALVVFATCPMVLYNGSAATTDATLLVGILASQFIFVRGWLTGLRWWHFPAMGLAIGFAQMVKGPVGLVIPLLTCATALIAAKGRSKHQKKAWLLLLVAVAISVGIFLAWGLPANAATGGEYAKVGGIERMGKRLFTAMEGHGAEGLLYLAYSPFYLGVIIGTSLPWILFLPGAVRCLIGRRLTLVDAPKTGEHDSSFWPLTGGGLRVLLLSMTLPTLIFMTIIVSKLPHYVLPMFPWLALMVGAVLEMSRLGRTAPEDRVWLRRGLFFCGPVLAVVAAATLVGPWLVGGLEPLRLGGAVVGGVAIVVMVIAFPLHWRGRTDASARVVLPGMIALIAALVLVLLPAMERVTKVGQNLGKALAPHVDPKVSVGRYGWYEPSLHFYLGGHRIKKLNKLQYVHAWMQKDGPRILVITEEGLAEFEDAYGKLDMQIIAEGSGIDHVKGRPLHLIALRKP
jgi:4-amino-4-deoxy-L-arabinose transferase-like glycosyltransferase